MLPVLLLYTKISCNSFLTITFCQTFFIVFGILTQWLITFLNLSNMVIIIIVINLLYYHESVVNCWKMEDSIYKQRTFHFFYSKHLSCKISVRRNMSSIFWLLKFYVTLFSENFNIVKFRLYRRSLLTFYFTMEKGTAYFFENLYATNNTFLR